MISIIAMLGFILGFLTMYFVAVFNTSYYFRTTGKTLKASIDIAKTTVGGKYISVWVEKQK